MLNKQMQERILEYFSRMTILDGNKPAGDRSRKIYATVSLEYITKHVLCDEFEVKQVLYNLFYMLFNRRAHMLYCGDMDKIGFFKKSLYTDKKFRFVIVNGKLGAKGDYHDVIYPYASKKQVLFSHISNLFPENLDNNTDSIKT